MVFFNDPVRCEDAPLRAIRMSIAMRTQVRALAETWSRQGHELALGIGIAQGYATLGKIGFDGRFDYAAIGSVTNLASRLCADAEPWQILTTERVFSGAGPAVVGEQIGERRFRGFSRAFQAVDIKGLDTARVGSWTPDCMPRSPYSCPGCQRRSATSGSTPCRARWSASGRRGG
jgi:class 3 adenylate cyclase